MGSVISLLCVCCGACTVPVCLSVGVRAMSNKAFAASLAYGLNTKRPGAAAAAAGPQKPAMAPVISETTTLTASLSRLDTICKIESAPALGCPFVCLVSSVC
jgi:hypothetical protein